MTHYRRRRVTASVLLAAAVIVLAGSLLATLHFRNRARDRMGAALALAEFETDTLQLGRAENIALQSQVLTPVVVAELARAQSAFDEARRVAVGTLPGGQRAELQAVTQPYVVAVATVTRLIAEGRSDEARMVDKSEEVSFAELRRITESLTARSEADAGRARREADDGFVLILVLSSLASAVFAGAAGIARRRAERTEAEGLGVRRSEARFKALVDNGDDVIIVTDAQARIREASESVGRVLGHTVDQMVGSVLPDWVHPDEGVSVTSVLGRVASGPDGFVVRSEWRWRHRDGGWRHIDASVTNLLGHPEVAGIVFNARDVTERRRLEEELRHRAFHDSLTGLANRALLQDRIGHALAGRHDRVAALAIVDLDGFKALNDSLGHPAGDHALIVVADRIRGLVRPEDTVARVGGDEFAVLVEDCEGAAEVEALALRLVQGLAEPLAWEGQSVVIGASLGIAFVESGLRAPSDLVRNADVALYAAKAAGRGQVRTFEPAMGHAVQASFTLESELRQALDGHEFVLHYQPVVELDTRRVVGFEALVRWTHPQRGLVPPLEFIPTAESSGLIVPLGRWILAEACRAAVGWSETSPGCGSLQLGVNLSVRQLEDPKIVDDVAAALTASGLDPDRLMLEITESVLMHDVDQALERLTALKRLGVRLAVDDFGTGYSSLSYLRRFPFDTVKIDKSFVDGVATAGGDAAFLAAILAVGEALGLETLAEGIESAEQAETLNRLHCRLGQGFYFAKPLDAAAVELLLVEVGRTVEPAAAVLS